MTDTRGGRSILDIIDDAHTALAATPPAPPQLLVCNQNHSPENLYYRRPFRTAPDTVLACRACKIENDLDQQLNPEIYEN